MASRKSQPDIYLLVWPGSSPEALRSAYRRKGDWVIRAPKSAGVWYTTVISNLENRLLDPEPSGIDSVRRALARGFHRSSYDRLAGLINIPSETLAAAVDIPTRTLARREIFKHDESERILRVASAFQHTLDTFEDLDVAREWFTAAQPALGGATPLAYCDSAPGVEAVERLLGRIDHGVFT